MRNAVRAQAGIHRKPVGPPKSCWTSGGFSSPTKHGHLCMYRLLFLVESLQEGGHTLWADDAGQLVLYS